MVQGKKDSEKKTQNMEEQIRNAISAFEQILEVMPNDRASLEALAHSYEQIGDHARAKDYLKRLAKLLVNESDIESANALLGALMPYADEDPEVKKLMDAIKKLKPTETAKSADKTVKKTVAAEAGSARRVGMEFNVITGELAFAWNLLEANELTQEEYSSVVQDLTDMSAGEGTATVSVLHVLEGKRFKRLEKILNFASKECAMPVICLSSFELQPATVSLLPLDFMEKRGAISFELLGNDALVVVLNPYDERLRKDIEGIIGKKCHYFLTPPVEFDHALEKIHEVLAKQSESHS